MSARRDLVEGRDYYCGTCVGRRVVACPACVVGCEECRDSGEIVCPDCKGGEVPVRPPDWL